ncbi:hypothetical protein [Nocardia tengchongensis]|uniref:hypothetical protein n=1 Tax=Nocardia tengchongensis TaxID=2055889 RepID=UPI003615DA25
MNTVQPAEGPELQRIRFGDLEGVTVTYGVVNTERFDNHGIPMLQVQNITGNRIQPAVTMRIGPDVHRKHLRTELRSGDLALVLVGRVGELALVTEEFAGWNVSRGIAVIRCERSEPCHLLDWLRYCFAAPSMREWFAAQARRSAQPTLSLESLRGCEVPVPSTVEQARYVELFEHMERRAAASLEAATIHLGVADALFEQWVHEVGTSQVALRELCQTVTGSRPDRPKTSQSQKTLKAPTYTVRPEWVLNARSPCADPRGPHAVEVWSRGAPGQLIIATKKGTAQVLLDLTDTMTAARGTLAVRVSDVRDQWWLLHELRSRRAELCALARGSREPSARALGTLRIRWPEPEVRHAFASLAALLHERAIVALEDHDDMGQLIGLTVERIIRSRTPSP